LKRPAILFKGLALLLIAQGSQALSVLDDLGTVVRLPAPAQRIVTLSPHATDLVMATGAAGRLVGIAGTGEAPDGLASLPRIGGHGGLDREALLALAPDLVIGWQSGNRPSDLDWIAGNGIALYRSEPASLRDIGRTLRDIGTLSGTGAQAETAARRFEKTFDNAPCGGLPPRPVYVVVWERPAMSVGGRHWINAALSATSHRNVLAQRDHGVFHIASEAAMAYAPLTQISLVRRFDGSPADRLADLLSRPGPRLADAVSLLCARRLSETTAGSD
jgi:iron complex transport system substrate-binding protein